MVAPRGVLNSLDGLGTPCTGLLHSKGHTQLSEEPQNTLLLRDKQPERAEQAELPARESLSDRAAGFGDREAGSVIPAGPGWRPGSMGAAGEERKRSRGLQAPLYAGKCVCSTQKRC